MDKLVSGGDLKTGFDQAMIEIYNRCARECDYRPTRFLQMVHDRGGLAAAKALLHASHPAEGLEILWEHGRLDLSVECVVQQEPWRKLFTDEEIRIAQNRLSDLGFKGN